MKKPIKVLIVDDSALVRKIFTEVLSKDDEIEVIGTAPNPIIARDKIVLLKPDILLLDIEMPEMDGLTFLEKLMKHYPMPVIIISSLAKESSDVAYRALELGAAEVLSKPGSSYSVKDMSEQLIEKIKGIAQMKKVKPPAIVKNQTAETSLSSRKAASSKALLRTTDKIIAIGASTGGTEAIKHIVTRLPEEVPPILITQHMPQFFTKSFAENLNRQSRVTVKEAEDKEPATPGKVLIAPGNKHMVLNRSGSFYFVEIKDGPLVHHQRPSVEVLFYSVAQIAGRNAIGVILTGMGKDGAEGLLEMRRSGAFTIAQDEESSVVFGMPKEAIAIGAAMRVLSLSQIPEIILQIGLSG